MATMVLQTAGGLLGSVFGPVGTIVGAAAGSIGGYLIDNALINSTRHFEGPRLTGVRPMTAEEGAPLPFVYGSARLSGTLIWATHFEEQKTRSRQGSKGGGPKTTSYSYFANAAFALAEGEIAGIRRIWVDGKEIDQTAVEMRVYRGTQDQPPDPLIEAKQGYGNVPAYRGTAYVVFERLLISDYGNRLPQFQFEVMRPVGALTKNITSVALIPGATEFGLSPTIITDEPKPGETRMINRNTLRASSDWNASLDELQALCPNLEHIALIVAWFGDDLRAGTCRIMPGVSNRLLRKLSCLWSVDGVDRFQAHLISRTEVSPAYGGTPDDQSVIDAIRDAKARGLKVTFYPFVMMDIPEKNSLLSPYGRKTQPAYPWRGRITCFPGPAQDPTVDRTNIVSHQIDAFLNGEWGYRRFIRHCAHLAMEAGGVNAFLLGSELHGLTILRDRENHFPFVEGLCTIATDLRKQLGMTCKLTYAADWSEYFGYHPQDGSGDVFFHLDPLWAHPAIDAVGIDNYMPLSDWRDEDEIRLGPDSMGGAYDLDGLAKNIEGGEGYDWYYANISDRQAQLRTPIIDELAGKHWVFRHKDLKGWWENPHYNRVNGRENDSPTAWIPMSKPFWFTELGCPAVDKGPNQPNIFPDLKSSENAVPYFSDGSRSDLAPCRFLKAHFHYWKSTDNNVNPISPLYGQRMLDTQRITIWAWDVRPFPEYPLNNHLWGDAENWCLGHWLNGRISGVSLDDLITAIFSDFALEPPDVTHVDGYLSGFVIHHPAKLRSILEPFLELFSVHVCERRGRWHCCSSARMSQTIAIDHNSIIRPEEGVSFISTLEDKNNLPGVVEVFFSDSMRDYQSGSALTVRAEGKGQGIQSLSLAGSMERGQAKALAESILRKRWAERRMLRLSLAWDKAMISVGDRIQLSSEKDDFIVTSLEDGISRNMQAITVASARRIPVRDTLPQPLIRNTGLKDGKPLVYLMDLPSWPGCEKAQNQFRLACYAKPWRGVEAYISPQEDGFSQRVTVNNKAVIGELTAPLLSGNSGRILDAQAVHILLYSGELYSQTKAQILNGANTAFLRATNGYWEIFQFIEVIEIAKNQWRLSSLLRGQLGTEEEASTEKPVGTPFILLNDAIVPAGLQASEVGLALNWRVGTAGRDFSDDYFDTLSATGGLRALEPLSPVHLKARLMRNGDIVISWVRRGRIDADSWLGADIPLGEDSELYRVEIVKNETLVRSVDSTISNWTYIAADRTSDLGGLSGEFMFVVSMISTRIGKGCSAKLTVNL